jgi:hypothetical protein
VTDLGLLVKPDPSSDLQLVAVPAGPDSIEARVARAVESCGWPLVVADDVYELPEPTAEEITALRSWDPRGWFLRG